MATPVTSTITRHQLRSQLRKWARAEKKANADRGYPGLHFTVELAKELAAKLVSSSDPSFGQVRDRMRKLLEESTLLDQDATCGDLRVALKAGAKL